MHWLRAPLCLVAFALLGCSNGDDSSLPPTGGDASQPDTKFEAGAPCHSPNDCVSGLTCLFPATDCQTPAVCAPPPPTPCDAPLTACSCLAETIQVCDGYGEDPISAMGPCPDSGVVVKDAGSDAPSSSDAASAVDAGPDTSTPGDATTD